MYQRSVKRQHVCKAAVSELLVNKCGDVKILLMRSADQHREPALEFNRTGLPNLLQEPSTGNM